MGEGVVKWLDDIGFYSKTFDEHLELIRKVVKVLIKHGYTGNFLKSEFFLSEIEVLGVMVGRDGIRPAPSKIKAVQELATPTTVGEVRSFLGLAGYLRGFVEDFSAITAPISDLLRNKKFSSKRARHVKVPFGPDQVNAFVECIKRLTTHPVMLLPDWNLPFTLHTDASTLATGAVLTQEVDGGSRQGPVGYYSKRLSRAQEKASTNDREVLGVLYAVEHFEIYLQHRQFTLITDCAALLWLFSSQNLSSKMHRWALKLMAYDMVLKWRRGTENVGPDALSRLRRRAAEEPEAEEDEVLEGELTPSAAGPVLEGVPLRELTPPLEGERRPQLENVTDLPSELLALAEMPREEIVLDGICLVDLGATVLDDMEEENLTVFYALQITPTKLGCGDEEWIAAQGEVQAFLEPRKPRAVVLGRGSGGMLQAVDETLDVTHVIDQDWMTFACIGANGGPGGATLVRHSLEPEGCQKILSEAKLEVLLGNVCCRSDDPRLMGATDRHASAMVEIFISSRAQVLVLETPVRYAGSEVWQQTLLPQLQMAGCEAETATLKATSVGVPTNKQRLFVAAAKRYGDDNLRSKLGRWKRNVERPAPVQPTVGAYLGKQGSFFLKRGKDAKEIFSFAEPTVMITMDHTMAHKPPRETFTPHSHDQGTLEEAEELAWEDYVKLTTTQEDFAVPNTMRRQDTARVLEEWTLPPMLREVLSLLQLQSMERSTAEAPGRPGPASAAARKAREAKEDQSAAEVDPSPPLQEPEQENSHMESSELQDSPSPEDQDSPSPEEQALSPQPMSTTEEPDSNMPDTELPAPAAEAASETAVIPGWDVLEIDIVDMKVETPTGNRYILVVVDRATKFLFGFPLPTKETVGVSRKLLELLELLLIFGLPLSIRCDPGTENTSEIMAHLCRWLKVSLDFGPANHPRGQGTVERMGAVLQQLLSELCQAWPQRWDEYVAISTWAHRMQPDESLPGHVSPYQMLFGRLPRTPLDQLSPSLDNSRAGLSFTVGLNGRQVRHQTVAASDMKLFHSRPKDLQHPFEDEFSHFVWGPDLGLVEHSVVASALYTLIDRKPTQGAGSVSEAWAWEYRGKYQDGRTSSWLTEDEVKDSFSPLQLDVFHALWEDYHGPDIAPRPPGAPTRGEREVATREAAVKEFPLNTEVGRELQDNNGNVIITRGKVCDFYDPYWRVEFSDGDWEELTRRELRRRIALASQVPPSAS
eukprot:g14325.t1